VHTRAPIAGAHLNWKNYSPIASLTRLTELQLAHCSGALPLAWLQGMPGLERLYLKGNGAAAAQMIALLGGAALLATLNSLKDLYLGLTLFTEDDGAHAPPRFVHLR
jgi:hypothetical protein